MLPNQMLTETPLEEREAILRDTCEAVELDYEYTKFLTEEELAQRRERKLILDIDLSKQKEELAQYIKDAKKAMEPLQMEANTLLLAVRDRVERKKATVYAFRDDENKMLGYYDATGAAIFARMLTPDERSSNLLSEIHISKQQ